MYAVTTYRSWSQREAGIIHDRGTFRERGMAMHAAQEGNDDPIVDVRDIGYEGFCPARPAPGAEWLGHEFRTLYIAQPTGGSREVCSLCSAWASDLYHEGTYIPRPAMDGLAELCECGHYVDDHDQRSAPPECAHCACGAPPDPLEPGEQCPDCAAGTRHLICELPWPKGGPAMGDPPE